MTSPPPHSFRRTVATTINRVAGADLAAQLLGHTSTEITLKHYIEPDTDIDTRTATILETLTPTAPAPQRSGTSSATDLSGDPTTT